MLKTECSRNCWVAAAVAGVLVWLFNAFAGLFLGGILLGLLVFWILGSLLVWLACQTALALGWTPAPLAVPTLVLVAALPSASNVSLLAERFEAHGGRVARIILVSTALAFFSFSAAVALLV